MATREWIDRVVSTVLAASAVTIAGSVAYRSFRPVSASPVRRLAPERVTDQAWHDALSTGVLIGGNNLAQVTIVEFTDLECPSCRGFQAVLDGVMAKWSGNVRLLYVPHPLPYHRFGMGAANAAECAARAGYLPIWIKTVYGKQDSLGLKSWGSYASEAGIADTAEIVRCARLPDPADRIRAGLALGPRIGVAGTPTVVINGWRFGSPPSLPELDGAISSTLRGHAPPLAKD